MATIYQVAEQAGVSLSTVSRVINGKATVNSTLKQRVESAMVELNYRPSLSAQSLATNKSQSVGILVSGDKNANVYRNFMKGLETLLRAANKHVVYSTCENTHEKEKAGVDFLVQRRCDALVLITSHLTHDDISHIKTVPFWFIGKRTPSHAEHRFLLATSLASYVATDYLLSLGHRHIGLLCTQLCSAAKEGFINAFEERRLELNEDLIVEYDESTQHIEEALMELLSRDLTVSAVCCDNDYTAACVMNSAREIGMELPNDLSVISLFDLGIGEFTFPQLTTITHPVFQLGESAAREILNAVYGQELEQRPLFEPQLQVNASTVENEN